jgi:flagellin
MAISSILTNTSAQYAANSIGKALDDLGTDSARLASGKRIINSKDDAAGLSIGVGLQTNATTLKTALTNAQQANSVLSIADGALDNISQILGRLKALAVTANSATVGASQLTYIQSEISALLSQVTSIVGATTFNGTALLDGTFTSKTFQIGINAATDIISVSLPDSSIASGLSISTINVSGGGAVAASNAIDTAISTLSGSRATVGALQSRFGYAAANLQSAITNTTSAAALLLDADFARSSTDFAQDTTRIQAGISTLAQVNQIQQNLLKLLS